MAVSNVLKSNTKTKKVVVSKQIGCSSLPKENNGEKSVRLFMDDTIRRIHVLY